jgi:hypothetical protein
VQGMCYSRGGGMCAKDFPSGHLRCIGGLFAMRLWFNVGEQALFRLTLVRWPISGTRWRWHFVLRYVCPAIVLGWATWLTSLRWATWHIGPSAAARPWSQGAERR